MSYLHIGRFRMDAGAADSGSICFRNSSGSYKRLRLTTRERAVLRTLIAHHGVYLPREDAYRVLNPSHRGSLNSSQRAIVSQVMRALRQSLEQIEVGAGCRVSCKYRTGYHLDIH